MTTQLGAPSIDSAILSEAAELLENDNTHFAMSTVASLAEMVAAIRRAAVSPPPSSGERRDAERRARYVARAVECEATGSANVHLHEIARTIRYYESLLGERRDEVTDSEIRYKRAPNDGDSGSHFRILEDGRCIATTNSEQNARAIVFGLKLRASKGRTPPARAGSAGAEIGAERMVGAVPANPAESPAARENAGATDAERLNWMLKHGASVLVLADHRHALNYQPMNRGEVDDLMRREAEAVAINEKLDAAGRSSSPTGRGGKD